MIPSYEEFKSSLRESTEPDPLVRAIEREMSWQSGRLYEVEGDDPKVTKLKREPAKLLPRCKKFYLYECPDGSSVRADLLAACRKHGFGDAQVAIVDNSHRNSEHYYLIGLP